ncbi:MAG TPA: CDP-alcohol phosphatidyltransferase [Gemmataceae bacterium]|nr:CDP-alcohol phosphatidyltransferase [Gemmataceae bacterium]
MNDAAPLRLESAAPRRRPRPLRQALAWCVHFYTALGLVAAAGITLLIVRGGPESFRWAFVLMLVATLIDATDGTFARAVRVKEVLPGFDGRRLDDLIDFLTYTCLPLFLAWRAEILPPGQEGWLLVPLLASAYGFCQVAAKTDDGFFLGFPSYWNLVAFYLYVLRPPSWLALAIVLTLAVLTFVPLRYLYPTSQPGRLNRLTNLLGAVWAVLLAAVVWRLPGNHAPEAPDWLAVLSLFFPVYYMGLSWAVSWKVWRARHGRKR